MYGIRLFSCFCTEVSVMHVFQCFPVYHYCIIFPIIKLLLTLCLELAQWNRIKHENQRTMGQDLTCTKKKPNTGMVLSFPVVYFRRSYVEIIVLLFISHWEWYNLFPKKWAFGVLVVKLSLKPTIGLVHFIRAFYLLYWCFFFENLIQNDNIDLLVITMAMFSSIFDFEN